MFSKKYSRQDIASVGEYVQLNADATLWPELIRKVLNENGRITNHLDLGTLIKPRADMFAYIESQGGCLFMESEHYNVFLWIDKSYIIVNDRDQAISLSGNSFNGSLTSLIQYLIDNFISHIESKLVYTIIQTPQGYDIQNMGNAFSPLIRDNYHPEVIADVDHIIKSFQKDPPNGRIAILSGEPGTGKTHLIRGLLAEMDCVFLIVPADLVSELAKPAIVPLLLKIKQDHDKPVVMIIEDGDICLVPRKNDNISITSALLNLSDGILGTLIDIKMIISTNAQIDNMDEAIMRPGRLCKYIHVGSLPYEQANRIYQRLNENQGILEYRKLYTLAEVYAANNQNIVGISPGNAPNKRSIGFDRPSNNLTINKGNNQA